MANPWDSSPIVQQAGSAFIPGTGPAAPSGYQRTAGGLAPIAGGPQDPSTAAAMAAAEAAARARASTPIEVSGQIAAAQAKAQIETQAALQRAMAERQLGPQITGAQRTDAIDRLAAANRLESRLQELRTLFAEGPGSTKGLAGLMDFLPSDANQRFNSAGDSLRGDIGQALGFTGGQLNSPTESKLNLGAYIPNAGERDSVNQDTFKRLEDLIKSTRASAGQILGTQDINQVTGQAGAAPDRSSAGAVGASNNGSVPPSGNGNGGLPSPFTPTGPAAPVIGLATGSTRNELAPQASALIDAGIRSGLTDDQINASLKAIGFNQTIDAAQSKAARDYLAANPDYKGSFGQATQQVDNSVFNQAASGPAGAYFTNAADALTLGTLDELSGDPTRARANLDMLREQNPGFSTAGAITGGVLAAGGLEAGLGAGAARLGGGAISRLLANPITADAAYGSAYGAGSADEGSRSLGALVGGSAGVGGGMFGRGLARGAGRALRGSRDASVRYLRNQGIPLTAGQAIGGRAKSFEDAMTSIPFVGDAVNARRLEGFQALNRAAFDQAAAPANQISTTLAPQQVSQIGARGVGELKQIKSDAYGRVLDPLSLQVDAPFGNDYALANMSVGNLPDDLAPRAATNLRLAGQNFDANGQISGEGIQQALRRFNKSGSENENLPNGFDYAKTMRAGIGAFEGLLDRQAPGAVADYQLANQANRGYSVLKEAVSKARNGSASGEIETFTPAQLSDAAEANAKKFGGTHGTTEIPFYDLARAGQAVLPSKLPDSGTGRRLASIALTGGLGGVGGGLGYAADGGSGATTGLAGTALLGAALAAGGTKPAQRFLSGLVTDRPDALIRIGDKVYDRARIGGMFGAGLGVGAPSVLFSR